MMKLGERREKLTAAREVHRAERLLRLFGTPAAAALALRHVLHRDVVDIDADETVRELAPNLLEEYVAIDGAVKLLHDRLRTLDEQLEQAKDDADRMDAERRRA